MQLLGYKFEYRGQYLRIKPHGYNKFFRMDKLADCKAITERKGVDS